MLSRADLVEVAGRAKTKGYAVYAPVRQEAGVFMVRIDDAGTVDFDHVLTVNTLKDVMLPRCERLATFDLDRQEIAPVPPAPERVLVLGSRPCDAAALDILDSILIGQVQDARYAARRRQTVVMTLACSSCDEACFCTSMGYGPHDPTGSDVLGLPHEGGYIIRALTDKGKGLLREMGLDEDAGGQPMRPPDLGRSVDTSRLKGWLDANFDSPVWQEVSEGCVSCGACYYLCPTCHCFDITDETGVSRGERTRIWDCCSFSGFTKMAGHQPRVGRHARYRQRVMHKFKYCVDNVGKVACVGDGRCVRFCPYGIDICEILKTLMQGG